MGRAKIGGGAGTAEVAPEAEVQRILAGLTETCGSVAAGLVPLLPGKSDRDCDSSGSLSFGEAGFVPPPPSIRSRR